MSPESRAAVIADSIRQKQFLDKLNQEEEAATVQYWGDFRNEWRDSEEGKRIIKASFDMAGIQPFSQETPTISTEQKSII